MPFADFVQLLVVAVIAGYVGYRLGRASVQVPGSHVDAPSPLPGPAAEAPQRERQASAPPPAGAGAGVPGKPPPRRTSAPPPAAAGLMTRDGQ
jgi:hypothetical protein